MNELFTPWPALAAYGKYLADGPAAGLFYYDVPAGETAPARSPAAPAVILIHGLGDEADSWRHIIPLLCAAGYRTLVLDLPGFGRSGTMRPCGIAGHSSAVISLLEAAGIDNAALTGNSMGAVIAEAAALARPDLIRSIILVDGCIPSGALSKPLLFMALPFTGKKWYRAFRNDAEALWQ